MTPQEQLLPDSIVSRRRITTLLACTLLAALAGYLCASDSYGMVQPAILVFMLISALAGGVLRHGMLALLGAALIGYAGAGGIIARLAPQTGDLVGFLALEGTLVAIPCIVVAYIAASLPTVTYADAPNENRCQKCGYNLTGNVSGRCPECGTPLPDIAPANVAATIAPPAPDRPQAPAMQQQSRVRDRLSFWLVITITAVTALLSTNNWCFILLPAALAAWIIDYLVRCVRPFRLTRLLAAVITGIAVGLLLSVGPAWAFNETFGIDPPPGVSNVRVSRHYVGGPGEHILIMSFDADRNALRTLTSLTSASTASERVKAWESSKQTWTDMFRILAGPTATRFARSAWQRIPPLSRPQVHEFDNVDMFLGRSFLLHDPDTGRCVALHVRS